MKRIFLAEDDTDDQEIFREVIAEIDDKITLMVAEDGEVLIEKINRLGDDELPDLIILDQNMPKLKGHETIGKLRTDAKLAKIPAVIYSTYHDTLFIEACRTQQIDLYLKPDTYNELKDMIDALIKKYDFSE